jgi:predicted membrane-bound mannosyltransferase
VARARATEDDWRVYYDRARAQRAVMGDPFMRHIERETFRERVMLAGSSLVVLALVSAFYLLTTR